MKKENYQKFFRSLIEAEPIDIAGEEMFVREIEIQHITALFSGHVLIIIRLNSGSVLCFRAWDYDDSWDNI